METAPISTTANSSDKSELSGQTKRPADDEHNEIAANSERAPVPHKHEAVQRIPLAEESSLNTSERGQELSSPSSQLSLIDPETLRAIVTAKEISNVKTSVFTDRIREIADQLPEVTVTSGDEKLRWQAIESVDVTTSVFPGTYQLALFKFRSPLDGPADMHWSFAVPDHLGEWFILPVKGEMKGFQSFKYRRNMTVPEVPLEAGSLFVVQELMQGRIQPNEEYIIWYIAKKPASGQMWAALRLTEAKSKTAGTTIEEISRNVGIDLKDIPFAQDESGLKAAYRVAFKMIRSKPADQPGFERVLRSVWDQLPLIEISQGVPNPIWNRVRPYLSNSFHAVRFKPQCQAPSNFNWCYVAERSLMRWGFVERHDSIRIRNKYALELNCPIPGILWPEKNLAMFQKLEGGLIRPQAEYAIWFAMQKEPLSDFEVAGNVTSVVNGVDDEESLKPPRESEHLRYPYADSRPVGTALGIEIPAVPSEERVNAAFDRCRQMIDAGEKSREFTRLIEFTMPALTELDPYSEAPQWHEVRLNEKGRRMSAFKLPHKGMEGGRMLMALTRPQHTFTQYNLNSNYEIEDSRVERPANAPILTWGILNDFWPGVYGQDRKTQKAIADLDLSVPPNQSIDIDYYHNWSLEAEEPMVVVFSPPDDKTVTLSFAARFEDEPISEAIESVRAAIEYLGLNANALKNDGEILNTHNAEIGIVRFVISKDAVVSADRSGEFKWWVQVPEVDAPKLDQKVPGTVRALSVDGKRLVAVDDRQSQISILRPGTLEEIGHFKLPAESSPETFSFSSDGGFLLGCYAGQRADVIGGLNEPSVLYRWDLDKPDRPITRKHPLGSQISSACWIPDGRIVTVGHRPVEYQVGKVERPYKIPLPKGKIEFLDGSTLETQSKIQTDGADWTDVECSADGTRLATLAHSGWLTVWDLRSKNEITSFPLPIRAVRLSISKDGNRLALMSYEGEILICDVESHRLLGTGPGQIPLAKDLAISPDGESIVMGGKDGQVRRYQIHEDRPQNGLPQVLMNSIGMKLNWIPSGKFLMGRSEDISPMLATPVREHEKDQLPSHQVNLTHAFYIGRYEVTVAEFRQFVEATGYQTTAEKTRRGGSHIRPASFDFQDDPKLNWKSPGFLQHENHPVVQVSYNDAVAFCEWLSNKEGVKYRLPTEAEWEYCCRAGSRSACYYNFSSWQFRCANLADGELIKVYGTFPGAFANSDGTAYTASVGSYIPNGFGLYDMLGNAWEWCADYYDPRYYAQSPADDPKGPDKGSDRIQRGGGFMLGGATSNHRDRGPSDQTQSHLGFRIVRDNPKPVVDRK